MTEINNPNELDREEHVNIRQQSGYQQQTQVVEDLNANRRVTVSRIAQLIWLFFGVIEAFIGIRVVLKLIAANPANPFANLIYRFTDIFLWPFSGLTVTPQAEGMVLEISSIIAILVYALLAWIIVRLVWLLFYRPASRSVRTIKKENY
ncbi:MAG: hypothetical protein CL609_14700 [Anaerolineaceae bacterium]|nr:hypothetical protein [Anaerolineaceae bacterium]